MNRPSRWLVVEAGGLLLASCRSVIETELRADGSGELRSAVVFSASELAGFAQGEANAGKSICDELRAQAPPEATFVEEERAGETHCTTVRAFASVRELREIYAGLPNVTVGKVQFDWGRLVYEVDVRAIAPSGQGEGSPLEWRVTLPGEVRQTNAAETDGGALVWQIPAGTSQTLHAESSVGLTVSTLGTTGAAVIAIGLALILGAILVTARRA